MIDEPLNLLRMLNLLLSASCLVLMVALLETFRRLPRDLMLVSVGLAVLVASAFYSTVESLHRAIPPGPRTGTVTSGLLILLIGLVAHASKSRRPRNH